MRTKLLFIIASLFLFYSCSFSSLDKSEKDTKINILDDKDTSQDEYSEQAELKVDIDRFGNIKEKISDEYSIGFIDTHELDLNNVNDIEFLDGKVFVADKNKRKIKVYNENLEIVKTISINNFSPIKLSRYKSKLIVVNFYKKPSKLVGDIDQYLFFSLLIFNNDGILESEISLPISKYMIGIQDLFVNGDFAYISKISPVLSDSKIFEIDLLNRKYRELDGTYQSCFTNDSDSNLYAINTFEHFRYKKSIDNKISGFNKKIPNNIKIDNIDNKKYQPYYEGFDINNTHIYSKKENSFERIKTIDKGLGITSIKKLGDFYIAYSSALSSIIKYSSSFEYVETLYKFESDKHLADSNASIKIFEDKVYLVSPASNLIAVIYNKNSKTNYDFKTYDDMIDADLYENLANLDKETATESIAFHVRKEPDKTLDREIAMFTRFETSRIQNKNNQKFWNFVLKYKIEDVEVVYNTEGTRAYYEPVSISASKLLSQDFSKTIIVKKIPYFNITLYTDSLIRKNYFYEYEFLE